MMNQTTDATLIVGSELYPVLFQCFFIISAGYIAGQFNLLTNAHSIGLSRYISNFALPAVIFKNLVDIKFQNFSWQFLTSVLISKTIIFFLTIILTYLTERPRNFANIGQYAMMATRSNDFALILPIIEAVYKQSHPEYSQYVYLIAPISLVILNPIGLFLIEIQKHIDDQRRHRGRSCHTFRLLTTVFRNVIRNPMVLSTLFGVIFNQIFKQHLPYSMEYILTPIAQSFTAIALFYLGLTMVGKLNYLHAHLVIIVFLLSITKLIIFPLILRQAVFFLVKPINGSLHNTIDYSNLGFLYGTAPIAPSVIFDVPEAYVALQAVASTGLVVSTLLAGPIMLVSAKMINLHTLDIKTTESYEILLTKTAYDVSILSLFCTIIVLIGFCLRYRWLKISFIHKYTFIFVGLQMILAIWTIGLHYIKYPLLLKDSVILRIGSILIAFTTRTWLTSLSTALMITICYSNQLAYRYSWIYHIFGWIVPLFISLILYFYSTIDQSKEISIFGKEKFRNIQIILSIILLFICILINTINLLRITRRTYRLRHDLNANSPTIINEIQPLMNDEEEIDIQPIPQEIKPVEADSQLFRHGILVTLLTIDAIVCVSVLLWLILSDDRDGIYYELQFFDTVLLHGQGIITFLVFALDADFLVPISRKFIELFYNFGFNLNRYRNRSVVVNEPLDPECKIRTDFNHHQRMREESIVFFVMNTRYRCCYCCCEIPIESRKQRYIEPIFQAYIKQSDVKPIHCLSNKCENCLNEYFENILQQSYQEAFLNQKDTLEMGRPNAVVTSPNITINDEQMKNMQDEAMQKLQEEKNEFRKRYAIMQMNDKVFFIGGYVVHAKTGERKKPKNDYIYNTETKELISIPPLPGNGRMSFGLAATEDGKIIGVGGHDFDYETRTNATMLDTQAEKLEWQNLPEMPNGTIGPGVGIIDNTLYVVGGFDFVGREILCHGDVLVMDLEKKQWKTLTELDPPRARPLVSIVDNTDPPSLIVAGGYNFDKNGKAVPYGKIEEYDTKKKKWNTVADIPDFKTTNGLATKNNKLFLMDTSLETGESHVIKEYNLETRTWESAHDVKQSTDRDNEKNPT